MTAFVASITPNLGKSLKKEKSPRQVGDPPTGTGRMKLLVVLLAVLISFKPLAAYSQVACHVAGSAILDGNGQKLVVFTGFLAVIPEFAADLLTCWLKIKRFGLRKKLRDFARAGVSLVSVTKKFDLNIMKNIIRCSLILAGAVGVLTAVSHLAAASSNALSTCGMDCCIAVTTPMAGTSTNAIPDLLTTCPVTGEKLGEMGSPVVFVYKNQEVKLCCKGCKKDFDKDPQKYLKLIRAADKKSTGSR